MVTQESRIGSVVRGVGSVILFLLAAAILLGIGYVYWPKVKAAYYAQPATTEMQPTQPATGTSEVDKLKAQNAAIQAQLNAARAAQPRTIVQEVPEGAAPQTLTKNEGPPPSDNNNTTDNSLPPSAPPAPAQMIIVLHENDAHGAPVVTGSGACAVAAKGARRCGK